MSSPTKAEIVNAAFTEMRISGLTVNPSPSDTVAALTRLEDMMMEFSSNSNMNVGYNFEDVPEINSPSGVTRNFSPMMKYCLAERLIPMYNKVVPQTLLKLARGSLSNAQGTLAAQNIREVQPSRRMPRGSGNTLRQPYPSRFMIPVALPPQEAATNVIEEGETQDYSENFSAWLGGNTLSSFTISSDPRITINALTNDDPVINYTVTADVNSTYGPWQFVKITITDSAGRVNIRLVNFEILAVPTVPAP